MAPIVIKVDSFDVVIKDFKSYLTQAQFYSERCRADEKITYVSVAGRSCSVCTIVYVCPNGTLEVVLKSHLGNEQQYCFRGRVHFVEGNNSVELETVKFCHGFYDTDCFGLPYDGQPTPYCKCGSICKIVGANKEIRLR